MESWHEQPLPTTVNLCYAIAGGSLFYIISQNMNSARSCILALWDISGYGKNNKKSSYSLVDNIWKTITMLRCDDVLFIVCNLNAVRLIIRLYRLCVIIVSSPQQ